MNIKPIETYYDGYKFRSRLEARWAVFFRSAFIEYVYEPEGFVLSDGSCYLPDFYLPTFHLYVEIKPLEKAETEEATIAKNKLEQLFNGDIFKEKGNGICVAIFHGDPLENYTWIYCNRKAKKKTDKRWFPMSFLKGIHGEYKRKKYSFSKDFTVISVYNDLDDAFFMSSALDSNVPLISNKEITSYDTSFKYAKLKARREHFEHREDE